MIVALAGRRVDAADARVRRFPPERAGIVGAGIAALLRARGARALVAAAACGADLLAHEAAGALGLRRVVVLPFAPDEFRARSVADRPGDWGPRFDALVAAVAPAGDLVVLGAPGAPTPSEPYARANEAIVARATALAAAGGLAALAVLVWDGAARGANDMTAHFARTARARGLEVEEVATL